MFTHFQLPLEDSPIISPTINPQLTGDDGYYGWDVVEGCWYALPLS